MLHIFRLLLLSINIDKEIVLIWLKIQNPHKFSKIIEKVSPVGENDQNIILADYVNFSNETLNGIGKELADKIQNGLNVSDIENIIIFVLFIRFVILAIRYNLKTSFYITCIGILAGFIWYRHLLDVIVVYRNILIDVPLFYNLGVNAVEFRSHHAKLDLTNPMLGDHVHWSKPGELISFAVLKSIVTYNPDTQMYYLIDPLSMIISNLKEPIRSYISLCYYKLFNIVIPNCYKIFSKFSKKFSTLYTYTFITRIGKRYCPYLIRWHWTFLILMGFLEPFLVFFSYRSYHFQVFVLFPELIKNLKNDSVPLTLVLKAIFVDKLTTFVIFSHFGLILCGLFHAIAGQYFYFPFIVKNVELHVGERPKNSIYSAGQTPWQNEKESPWQNEKNEKENNSQRVFPKIWSNWFGRVTKNIGRRNIIFKKFLKNILKKFRRKFRR